jgi:hypothetical protein
MLYIILSGRWFDIVLDVPAQTENKTGGGKIEGDRLWQLDANFRQHLCEAMKASVLPVFSAAKLWIQNGCRQF